MGLLIVDRLKQYIETKGISNNKFGSKIGWSSAQTSQILSGNRNFGIDKLQKIFQNYPDLNAVWLFNGVGEMISANYIDVNDEKDIDFKIYWREREIISVVKNIKYVRDLIESNLNIPFDNMEFENEQGFADHSMKLNLELLDTLNIDEKVIHFSNLNSTYSKLNTRFISLFHFLRIGSQNPELNHPSESTLIKLKEKLPLIIS